MGGVSRACPCQPPSKQRAPRSQLRRPAPSRRTRPRRQRVHDQLPVVSAGLFTVGRTEKTTNAVRYLAGDQSELLIAASAAASRVGLTSARHRSGDQGEHDRRPLRGTVNVASGLAKPTSGASTRRGRTRTDVASPSPRARNHVRQGSGLDQAAARTWRCRSSQNQPPTASERRATRSAGSWPK